ncbi:uncharacterized protein [Choristoneura fumiferana]|uniref:uncharacterized protein n=1 Tax=Choristoneura fumiferana TaxID=7141 RepID=UPI003D15E0F0
MSLFHNAREINRVNPRKRKVQENIIVQESYSCDLCNDEYDSETDLHVHRTVKHKFAMEKMLIKDNVCKTCITKHDSYEHLVKHIKSVHLHSSEDAEYVEREIFICDICHLIYFNKQTLCVHILYCHNKERIDNTTADCPKCNRIIHVKNAWYHFQRHLIQSVGCCPICLKKCKNQRQLIHHVQNHQSFFKCNICQYDASNKKQFDSHMKSHNNVIYDRSKEDNVKCCFYPQIITRKSYFSAGLWGYRLHGLQICVLCRAICKPEAANDHISRCHAIPPAPAVKKAYICLCGENFFNNILLRHHVFKMNSDDHKACDK